MLWPLFFSKKINGFIATSLLLTSTSRGKGLTLYGKSRGMSTQKTWVPNKSLKRRVVMGKTWVKNCFWNLIESYDCRQPPQTWSAWSWRWTGCPWWCASGWRWCTNLLGRPESELSAEDSTQCGDVWQRSGKAAIETNSVTMRVDDKVKEKSTTVHVAEDAPTFPETKSGEDDNIWPGTSENVHCGLEHAKS